ncbi:MAG: hypothetical protein R3A12_00545 [Ignavibacteria bacterium]
MNDIFSNASTTMNKYSEGSKKKSTIHLNAKNCGAPRLGGNAV